MRLKPVKDRGISCYDIFEVFKRLSGSENIKIVNAVRSIEEVSEDVIRIYDSLRQDKN